MSECRYCRGTGVCNTQVSLYADGTAPSCPRCDGKGTEPQSVADVLRRHNVPTKTTKNGLRVDLDNNA